MFDGETSSGVDLWRRSSSSTSPRSIARRPSAQSSPVLRRPFTALGRKTARSRAFSSSTKRGLSCRTKARLDFCRRRSSSPGPEESRTSLSCTVPRISQPPDRTAASLGVSLRAFSRTAKRSSATRRRTPRSTVQFSSLGCRKRRRDLLSRLRRGVALWRVGNRPYLVEHRLAEAEREFVDTDRRLVATRSTSPDDCALARRRRQPAKRRGLARSLGRDPYQQRRCRRARGRRRLAAGPSAGALRSSPGMAGTKWRRRVRSGCSFECSTIRTDPGSPGRLRIGAVSRVQSGFGWCRISSPPAVSVLAWCFAGPRSYAAKATPSGR